MEEYKNKNGSELKTREGVELTFRKRLKRNFGIEDEENENVS